MTLPVSGPGALSRRSDQPIRQVTGLPYGEAGALVAQQQGAPMAATPPTPAVPVTPLHAGSERPGEPVTHGADAGAGADSSILTATPGLPATGGAVSQAIARAAASDTSGVLQQLLLAAQQRGL
jgi:hypothetical protein